VEESWEEENERVSEGGRECEALRGHLHALALENRCSMETLSLGDIAGW
jgi:hypothetical protein